MVSSWWSAGAVNVGGSVLTCVHEFSERFPRQQKLLQFFYALISYRAESCAHCEVGLGKRHTTPPLSNMEAQLDEIKNVHRDHKLDTACAKFILHRTSLVFLFRRAEKKSYLNEFIRYDIKIELYSEVLISTTVVINGQHNKVLLDSITLSFAIVVLQTTLMRFIVNATCRALLLADKYIKASAESVCECAIHNNNKNNNNNNKSIAFTLYIALLILQQNAGAPSSLTKSERNVQGMLYK
uniref:Uncharacterized protein n=1 Tax=Glossina pallidipes TaxID=7398 RepID=A0A1A9ZWW5_GLOPL